MRFCHYCKLDTDTVAEDCTECGLSKPYDIEKETMNRKNEVGAEEMPIGFGSDLELNYEEDTQEEVEELDFVYIDDDYDDEMDDDEYEEGSYFKQGFGEDSIDRFCDEFEEE